MSTKDEIDREYNTLTEIIALLMLAGVKSRQLEIAVERDQLTEDVWDLMGRYEFEQGIQHTAMVLGHGTDA